MSAIVVPDVGKAALLNRMIKLTVSEDLTLKLYRNNYTPAADSIISDFTEANFTNYTSRTLTTASWTAAAIVAPTAPCLENEALTTYAEQSWTAGIVGNTVYGYYVVGASSGTLMWAQKFGSARDVNEGDVLRVIPQFKFRTQLECGT